MLDIKEVKKYLLSRKIAVAFEKLSDSEKNDETALKFMVIIDYEMERKNVYKDIIATKLPKLTEQLFCFPSYKDFTYYEYQGYDELQGKNLQCRNCDLFGPYTSLLTHMATNHNIYISNQECAYCKRNDMKEHFRDVSLEQCYEDYLRKMEISEIYLEATAMHDVVKKFYDVLKMVSRDLKVDVHRTHVFAAKGYGKGGGRQGSKDVTYVQKMIRSPSKKISLIPEKELHVRFVIAVENLSGGNTLSRLVQHPEPQIEDITEDNPDSHGHSSNQHEQYEPTPSTSFNVPQITGFYSGNPLSFNDRRLSTMSYRTSTPSVPDPDMFLNYLHTKMNDIPDPKIRTETELQILDIAIKAKDRLMSP